jgi:hypothetical protein
MSAVYSFNTPAGTVTLTVPSCDAVAAHHRHQIDDAMTEGDHDTVSEMLAEFHEDGFGQFLLPVWWVDPAHCGRHGAGFCTCGRVSLVDVLSQVDNTTGRQAALDAHKAALVAGYEHLDALEDLIGGRVRQQGWANGA